MQNPLKLHNPYQPTQDVLVPPETIAMERKSAQGKAKATYPHKPLGIGTGDKSNQGKAKVHALTPGTSPTGS